MSSRRIVREIVNIDELDFNMPVSFYAKKYNISDNALRSFLKKNGIFDKFIYTGYKSGCKKPWNKGLTEETSYSVKKGSIKLREKYRSGDYKSPLLGRKLTEEQKRKLSKTISNKVKEGTWHYSFSKVRTHLYESLYNGVVKLMGSWELEFAKYLDHNNIKWTRPKDKFYYEYDKLKRGFGYYTPDFYLLAENLWIEIKGYETDRDRAKWKWFPHKLKILKGKDLTQTYKLNIIDKPYLQSRDKRMRSPQ